MNASILSLKLENHFKKIILTSNRLNNINNSSTVYIAKRDIDTFYEGMFLKTVTLFESFLEELFIGLLYDKYSLPTRKKVQKIIFNDRKLVKNYILFNKPILTLLPYDNLRKYHKGFYVDDNPFNTLSNSQKTILKDLYVIRNAISHNSITANKKFRDFLIKCHPSFDKSMTASRYLQTLMRPGQTRFDNYLFELNLMAHAFCNYQ